MKFGHVKSTYEKNTKCRSEDQLASFFSSVSQEVLNRMVQQDKLNSQSNPLQIYIDLNLTFVS